MADEPPCAVAAAGVRAEGRPGAGIDWLAVERDYREGRLSLRDLAGKHGCSHSAIANRATRLRWTRVVSSGLAVATESAQWYPTSEEAQP